TGARNVVRGISMLPAAIRFAEFIKNDLNLLLVRRRPIVFICFLADSQKVVGDITVPGSDEGRRPRLTLQFFDGKYTRTLSEDPPAFHRVKKEINFNLRS